MISVASKNASYRNHGNVYHVKPPATSRYGRKAGNNARQCLQAAVDEQLSGSEAAWVCERSSSEGSSVDAPLTPDYDDVSRTPGFRGISLPDSATDVFQRDHAGGSLHEIEGAHKDRDTGQRLLKESSSSSRSLASHLWAAVTTGGRRGPEVEAAGRRGYDSNTRRVVGAEGKDAIQHSSHQMHPHDGHPQHRHSGCAPQQAEGRRGGDGRRARGGEGCHSTLREEPHNHHHHSLHGLAVGRGGVALKVGNARAFHAANSKGCSPANPIADHDDRATRSGWLAGIARYLARVAMWRGLLPSSGCHPGKVETGARGASTHQAMNASEGRKRRMPRLLAVSLLVVCAVSLLFVHESFSRISSTSAAANTTTPSTPDSRRVSRLLSVQLENATRRLAGVLLPQQAGVEGQMTHGQARRAGQRKLAVQGVGGGERVAGAVQRPGAVEASAGGRRAGAFPTAGGAEAGETAEPHKQSVAASNLFSAAAAAALALRAREGVARANHALPGGTAAAGPDEIAVTFVEPTVAVRGNAHSTWQAVVGSLGSAGSAGRGRRIGPRTDSVGISDSVSANAAAAVTAASDAATANELPQPKEASRVISSGREGNTGTSADGAAALQRHVSDSNEGGGMGGKGDRWLDFEGSGDETNPSASLLLQPDGDDVAFGMANMRGAEVGGEARRKTGGRCLVGSAPNLSASLLPSHQG